MSKIPFGWLTSCILSCSIAVLTIPFGKAAQAQPDEAEQVVASFHQAIQDNNFDSLDRYYCSAEKLAAEEFNRYADPNGRKGTLFDAYVSVATSLYSFDMSNLYYETKYYDPELERAVVAITGNVLLESSNGQTAAIPYRQFSAFGRDWLRLIKENGEWKLCHNLEE